MTSSFDNKEKILEKLLNGAHPVSQEQPSRFRLYVLGLIFIIYVITSSDRANIGIVLPYLKKSFHLSNTEAGGLASIFYISYGLFQIPSAFLIKRLGVKNTLPLALFLTSISTALHGMVGSLLALKFCRVLLGISEAPIASGCITSINNWFPAREKGLAAGLFIAAAKTGPVIVPILGAVIILSLGWEYVFIIFALPGLILPFFWFFLVPDDPIKSHFVNHAEVDLIKDMDVESISGQKTNSLEQIPLSSGRSFFALLDRIIRSKVVQKITTSKDVFFSWNVWGVSLGYFFFIGTMSVILAWLPSYLTEVKGFSIIRTGFLTSMPFIGAVVGSTLGGWISDRLLDKRRKPLMMFSCLSTIFMMYALRSAPNDPFMLSFLLIATGFSFSMGFSLFSIFAAGLCERNIFPVATAVLNTCGQLGGAAMPFIAGIILDHYDWNAVFLTLSFGGGLALIVLSTIVEPRGFLPK
ncbi:MAG: MFS transporter [Robiginitomaculum sp.]|nr:MAG: MFS transporter [Robiginitomaculum sp.]